MEENRYVNLSLGRFIAESSWISNQAQDIFQAMWWLSTRKGYAGHVKWFIQYGHRRNVDPFEATIKLGIEYLTEYFHTRVGYSSIKTARSVLSTVIKTENDISLEGIPLVCRFLKRVFNLRPAFPGYSSTMDISVFLKYISLEALTQFDLKSRSNRLAILLCVTIGQRDQTMSYINIDLMFEADKVTIFVLELFKRSCPGHHLEPMVLLRYPDQEICVVSHFEQYIEKKLRTFERTKTSW